MKQNIYDNDKFFEKYSQMNRSKEGLIAAGEWETLKKFLPNFKGKTMLDLGCGYGWHCIYAIDNGATKVVGLDISEKMLEVAKQKTNSDKAEYICMAMEDINFAENSFDIVLSSLAFHYIADFKPVVEKIYTSLTKNGSFVFSVEHPVFTAEGSQNWSYDQDGKIKHFPVDNYYYEGKRTANFLGEDVTKYHRTLTTYLNTLLDVGFKITNIIEPMPPAHLIDSVEGMKDEMRRPMMLIACGVK